MIKVLITTLMIVSGALLVLSVINIVTHLTREEPKYSTRCVEVFSLPVPIYRCENAEVICYNSAAEGMLSCEQKR